MPLRVFASPFRILALGFVLNSAALSHIDIGSVMPEGVTLQSPVLGTPTFLIIHNGQEIDRQRGYDNAEMFWWWLSDYAVE